MQIMYHQGTFSEVAITASPLEFAAVAVRIAELVAVGVGEAVFPASGSGLSALEIRIGSGPAVAAVLDSVLSVSGSCEAIEQFGRNLPTESSLPSGYHVHFEHAGRESFVAAKSVPLVMVIGSAGGAL